MNEAVALKEPMQSLNESFIVPKDYPELQSRFGPHILKLLQRHNEYPGNFEDLHNYVWMRLLEAKLLEKFEEYLKKNGLKVLSATQACEFLGVTWQQWVDACRASHTGARPHWMPTPVNLAEYNIEGITWYDVPTALFAFADIERLTWGERLDGELIYPFEEWGPAYLDFALGDRFDVYLEYPTIFSTASHFKNYLNRAVLNSHHNFCRTVKRRHKERPQSPQGSEGHLTAWEDTLVEPNQAASYEYTLEADEARVILRAALEKCYQQAGLTFGGDEERKVCALLIQGITLPKALRQCGLSPKLSKSVINSIRTRSQEIEADGV